MSVTNPQRPNQPAAVAAAMLGVVVVGRKSFFFSRILLYVWVWVCVRKFINYIPMECLRTAVRRRKQIADYIFEWNDWVNSIRCAMRCERNFGFTKQQPNQTEKKSNVNFEHFKSKCRWNKWSIDLTCENIIFQCGSN